jgi:DNA-binding transcriptional MerR regulator
MPESSTADLLTPSQMSEVTGVSIDTLRYYEREGLLRTVDRAPNGHRRYHNNDVLWVQVLKCLRATGMTIQDLRHYCDLGQEGTATEPERYALLLAHRDTVRSQLAELEESLELIEHKMSFYPQHDSARSAGKDA